MTANDWKQRFQKPTRRKFSEDSEEVLKMKKLIAEQEAKEALDNPGETEAVIARVNAFDPDKPKE